LHEISAIPGVRMASKGFLTPADEGAAFTDIKYEGAANGNKESVQLRWGLGNCNSKISQLYFSQLFRSLKTHSLRLLKSAISKSYIIYKYYCS